MPKRILLIALLTLIIILSFDIVKFATKPDISFNPAFPTITPDVSSNSNFSLIMPPAKKLLENNYHIFQTFNNCGPAALSMALSYFGVNVSQQKLGEDLRPYQNIQGDNDDKSVTLEELADKSKEYGFIPYHRPNGNIKLIKLFITYDIPIIARTLTKANEDIGHYRVVKGYDETSGTIIQDDSLQGKNLEYLSGEFNILWEKFNYEYLVLVPNDKKEIAEMILGEDVDFKTSWSNAVKSAESQLAKNQNNIYTRFNLSIALYNVGNFKRSTEEFEKVENYLPFRTLWYQIEPVLAYFELGNYQKVFDITDKILNNGNRAFSELYLIRGYAFQKEGNIQVAKEEFEKAVFYNRNYKKAKIALESV